MEFRMTTDLAASLPKAIEFNFEELKAFLDEGLRKYQNLIVTEDGIKEAKADRAGLNKLRTAIDTARKDVKKQCLKPYEDFEGKIKILTGMIDKPVAAIDSQIKGFDEQRRENKLSHITEFYQMHVGDLIGLIPMEKVLNPKWANATVNTGDVETEMADRIVKARNDLKIIETMRLPRELQVKDAYLRNLDMSEALAEKARFEEQQAKLEKLKEKENASVGEPIAAPVKTQSVSVAAPAVEAAKTIKVIFYDTTAAFRAEMRALTEKHNIRYGGIQ